MSIKELVNFFSHAGRFACTPEKAMTRYQKKLGDPFYLQLNLKQGLWISGTPEAAKEIFTAKTNAFGKLYPVDGIEALLGPGSMILLSGEQHLQEKKCMSPLFHGDTMRLYGETVQMLAQAELNRWQPGKEYDLYAAMKNITLTVISRMVFGSQDNSQLELVNNKALRFVRSFSPAMIGFPLLRKRFWPQWRRYVAARAEFDQILLKQIEDCRQYPEKNRNDILAKLVQIGFTNDSLLDECRFLLLAGHETSATALTWALYYSLSNPEIKAKLSAEIGTLQADPSIEEIIKLPYLTAVCEEALRIHPIVPIIARTLDQEFTFGGKLLKPGETIALSLTLLHANPAVWEQPELFKPERFINKSYSPYEYAPFGGGAKRCVGAAFALYEMKIILATFFLQAKLAVKPLKNNALRFYGLTMGPQKTMSIKVQ